MTDIDRPAYPQSERTEHGFDRGLSIRQHAALTLRIPDSGDPTIDAMIRQAVRRDLAAQAMQGLLAGDPTRPEVAVSSQAIKHADALLAELEKSR